MTEHPVPAAPDRLEHGEGSRWTGDRLVLVDLLAGRLLSAPDEPGPLTELLRVDEPLGAVAPVAGHPGRWIAAVGRGLALLGPGGATTWLARPEAGTPAPSRMNDGVADPGGRFWAGSMACDGTPGAGSLYRVDHDLTVTRVLEGITIANGPAFTPDGRLMYVADTAAGLVRRYPVDPDSGELGVPEPFLTVPADEGGPDGMTVDREGALWVALWGGAAVHRYLPDGTLDHGLPLPARQPTSVCLGGADGHLLHITSATTGLDAPTPDDGALFTARVPVPGVPACPFRPGVPLPG
ncbi:SMP-30/gluconolactonase/LRE family protein [Streptomyces radicis]|uniref:SMP-30/gluconolactonase/LRE family protein n=1 Tax=Streptomyces radicis TaxID=1750517 RepID=A0A3A9WDZ7_9ACTN|nr:SMP-30/gluconolactonase/LRE family protein [Streptomyces radicis]RKN11561.1 SMP-30/gluconolactonase/LRE family protein [Streptomyces radicis]RKN26421.1 SMP-30/gluconolactonase/LRE family protein [Streptomyces radicis]